MVETKKVAEEVEEIVVFWVCFEYRAKKIGSRVEKEKAWPTGRMKKMQKLGGRNACL